MSGINPSFMISDLFSLGWNYNLSAPVIIGIRNDMPYHLRSLKVGLSCLVY